jgi:hypothetical protein
LKIISLNLVARFGKRVKLVRAVLVEIPDYMVSETGKGVRSVILSRDYR